jgi:Tfp pilus assembly pilus retraction ATPase PilT
MLTLEASLNSLVTDGLVSYDEAVARSMHPKEIKRLVPSHHDVREPLPALGN